MREEICWFMRRLLVCLWERGKRHLVTTSILKEGMARHLSGRERERALET